MSADGPDGIDCRLLEPTGPAPDGVGERTALLLPGLHYGADAPLLWWSSHVLRATGWHVASASWDPSVFEGRRPLDVVEHAARRLESLVDERHRDPARLLVCKSISTLTAAWAGRRGLPAVFLTPLLAGEQFGQQWLAGTLARYEPPSLLVGAAGDPLWDDRLAERAHGRVLRFERGGHDLLVGGDWRASLDELTRTCQAVARFSSSI